MTADFSDWYEKTHGYKPFPWQIQLAQSIASGSPPASISVPTGAGKTAVIAAWQWATLSGYKVHKRLIYIIDRRLIVDSVTEYAEQLGCHVIKMRGGTTIDESWLMDPLKPTVIVSTVSQAGSRLLWRGYGVSSRVAPIHAALIGNDALIVLDEAHISTPFATTLQAVKQLRQQETLPWDVIEMTATPMGKGDSLTLQNLDAEHPVLKKRLECSKYARLVKADKASFITQMVKEANTLQKSCTGVVGVICNYAETARNIFNRLSGDKVLLTGRIRPADKDQILEQYLPRMRSGSRENRQPLFVVATQTIEVGADLDFDGLVTQNAPFDALRQRFGRLDRLGALGESHAVIVHEQLTANDECLVYGRKLLNDTFSWLKKAQVKRGKVKVVDFGISAMDETLETRHPPTRPIAEVRPFTATNLRQLRQTEPQANVDITAWLHGDETDNISVSVVWRNDLQTDPATWAETVSAAQPVMAEAMPCPVYALRKWLKRKSVLANGEPTVGSEIKPGDVIVIPSDYGGYDPWGWEPHSRSPVKDIGNDVGAKIRLVGADENSDIQAELNVLGLDVPHPIATPYSAGLIIHSANRRVKEKAVTLETHMTGVGLVAKDLSDDSTVQEAARLHDIGKSDPRFQVLLGAQDIPLAKSGHLSPWAAQVAKNWSGLPKGWRHEIASVSMLPDDAPDLLRYLVATHHGFARAVMPIAGDLELWESVNGTTWGNMTERLNQAYGSWGLAYLETLVRLADWKQSKEEQRYGI